MLDDKGDEFFLKMSIPIKIQTLSYEIQCNNNNKLIGRSKE